MKAIGDVETKRKFTAVANGAITSGDPVVIESAGTVAKPSGSSGPDTSGSAVAFATGGDWMQIGYDSDSDKFIVAYRDGNNSSYGTAVVGNVSNVTISYGTPVVFETANTLYFSVAYDENAQKVVIAYEDIDNGQRGTAVVGTVSGTSISFGTPVVFNDQAVQFNAVVYDPSSQKVVIFYKDDGTAGDPGRAIVGTVSGTSISFGTEVSFDGGRSEEMAVVYDPDTSQIIISYAAIGSGGKTILGTVSGTSITFGTGVQFTSASPLGVGVDYDTVANKFVNTYRDQSNSSYGTAVVGTVSGTSVSFGTPVVYESANSGFNKVSYSAISGKMVVAYVDYGNSSRGTYAVGTVSGTSISFTSPAIFETGSTNYVDTVYASGGGKVIFTFNDGASKTIAYTPAYDSRNMTAENFIGFADKDYADGADASVELSGSITKEQSGLTAGQKYYVQNDGSLGTTADDPSVVAGTAISATELIVKG